MDNNVMECPNNVYYFDSDIGFEEHISSNIENENNLDSNVDALVEVSVRYSGIDGDDITVEVDNTNKTISAKFKTYIYEQAIASSVWNIQHNLGRYPSITVVDSAGDVVMCDPKYIDENNVRLEFTAEFGGKAYLN